MALGCFVFFFLGLQLRCHFILELNEKVDIIDFGGGNERNGKGGKRLKEWKEKQE